MFNNLLATFSCICNNGAFELNYLSSSIKLLFIHHIPSLLSLYNSLCDKQTEMLLFLTDNFLNPFNQKNVIS